MKKTLRPQVILYGLFAIGILIGAALGSTLTWAVMALTKAEAASFAPTEPETIDANLVATEAQEKIEEPIDSAVESAVETVTEEATTVVAEPVEELRSYQVGTCEITAYCSCVTCCGIWSEDHPSRVGTGYVQKTASGTIPTAGRTVAVDTDVIPMGAVVWINGVSYIAEDTGSAVKGKVVDVFFDDHETARQFGRQTAEIYYVN